jgi:hypothetical protein
VVFLMIRMMDGRFRGEMVRHSTCLWLWSFSLAVLMYVSSLLFVESSAGLLSALTKEVGSGTVLVIDLQRGSEKISGLYCLRDGRREME